MDGSVLPEPLLLRFSSAAAAVRDCTEARVFSHNDADGICTAGVLTSMLMRADKGVQTTMLKGLDLDAIRSGLVPGIDLLIVADMGSSALASLEGLGTKVVVLDHHRPERDSDALVHLNPSVLKVDGARYACASTLSMLLAVTVDERNWDLLPIAFAGMVGDRQHLQGLMGVNAHLFSEAIKKGLIQERKGTLLPPGPIGEGLRRSPHPFIRGVSGDPQGIAMLLQEARVRPDTTWEGLDEADRRRLSSLVALRLLEQGCSLGGLEEELAPDYSFPQDGLRASQLTRLVNACGRKEETALGLAMLLGEKDARERAEALLKDYEEMLLGALKRTAERGLSKLRAVQHFESPYREVSSELCGLVMQWVGDQDKATVCLTRMDMEIKVSARGTRRLVDERGLDLSVAMRDAAASVGGVGGGHNIAAGATIPLGKDIDFLQALDSIVARQMERVSAK
ncbi:MAG TPA: DHH family phosphoesterase [Methanomassiliicoccales archaeon]|nr:DHH family phosphoesterase [Methanomassiliicoccales archaeon]HQM67506.1 DHH family phosphoesterase [Methanomassiliicoccales archaeon]